MGRSLPLTAPSTKPTTINSLLIAAHAGLVSGMAYTRRMQRNSGSLVLHLIDETLVRCSTRQAEERIAHRQHLVAACPM
eukprot:3782089-Rhodomonas_salina.1